MRGVRLNPVGSWSPPPPDAHLLRCRARYPYGDKPPQDLTQAEWIEWGLQLIDAGVASDCSQVEFMALSYARRHVDLIDIWCRAFLAYAQERAQENGE